MKPQKVQRVKQDTPSEVAFYVQDTANPHRTQWGSTTLPTAMISMEKSHDTYTYPAQHTQSLERHMDRKERFWSGGTLARPAEEVSGGRADHFRQTTRPDAEPGAEPLFYAYHEKPYVVSLFAHHALREHVPALLGSAALESHARFGEYPGATGDLSPHSGAIVNRLVQKGLIEEPQEVHRNSIHKDSPDMKYYKETDAKDPRLGYSGIDSTDVPQAHMALGSQFIRHTLRPERAQPSNGAEQPPLF